MAARMIGYADLPVCEHGVLDELKITPDAGSELQPKAIVTARDAEPND